jgi:solute carrier family 35 protein E3
MGVDPTVVAAMAANFVVSVSVVWLNKFVYLGGFKFNMVMTSLHFFVTYLGLEICAIAGLFQRKFVPLRKVAPISVAFCGFVVFNNESLKYNSVGVYQLWKVMTTPAIVVIQRVLYGVKMGFLEQVCLVPVIIGVLIATTGDMGTNFTGTVCAMLGLVSTSFYQIWVKTEQQALELNAWQLLYLQAPVSMMILMFIAPAVDDVASLGSRNFKDGAFFWLAASAGLAFLVNLSIFLVIGKTSPVSYNVLGHAKLCTILLSGYFFFGEQCSASRFLGILMALGGVFSYTYVQLTK